MSDFYSDAEVPQSPLMREAMRVHGVDAAETPSATLRLANARCLKCEDADACFAWLAGEGERDAYRWFCPNAQLFDSLTKSLPH